MGFKIKKEKIRNNSVSKVKKTTKMWLFFGLAGTSLIFFNLWTTISMKQTVEIVKVNQTIQQDGLITEAKIESDTMLKGEYEKQGVIKFSDGSKRRAIMLWEDRDTILGNTIYASYYLREGSPLYWDALSSESPKQYAYLYQMEGELLKISMNAKEFGGMLVPGDRINIRVRYKETNYTLPSLEEYKTQLQSGAGSKNTTTEVEGMLFENVAVLDILNKKGESIFDEYYNLLKLSKAAQKEKMASAEFKGKIEPSEILLNVTAEEADNYMRIAGKSPTFMMTLLPRTSGNVITELLNELQ